MLVLCTGAGGYIGKYLTKFLRKSNKILPIFSHNCKIPNVLKCDLNEFTETEKLLEFKFDAIVHMACEVPLINGKKDSQQLGDNNKNIDKNIVYIARKKNVKLIYFSTCSLYDKKCDKMKNERSTVVIDSFYKESKKCGEDLVLSYEKGIVLRISSPYALYYLPNNIISIFFKQAKINKKIIVWGTGKREQDFVNLYDCARWIKYILTESVYGLFNMCSGFTVQTYELAQYIANMYNADISFNKKKDEQMQLARYDNRKLISETKIYSCSIC